MPALSPEEESKQQDLAGDRKGFFHKWVEEVDPSGDIPCIKPVALVEDVDEGRIYTIDYNNIRFVEDWE